MGKLERRRFYLHEDVMRELEVYASISGKQVSVVLEEILVEFLFPELEHVSEHLQDWEGCNF